MLAWGNSDYGQLGLGGTTHFATPRVVEDLGAAGVVRLAAGGWHSAAVTASGGVFVWGRGEYGRLGLGDNWKDRLRPTELHVAAPVAEVACGGSHSLVITAGRQLMSFGRPAFGRLGRSGGSNPNVPNPVEFPPPPEGRRWACESVSAGGRHTLALVRAVPLAGAAPS